MSIECYEDLWQPYAKFWLTGLPGHTVTYAEWSKLHKPQQQFFAKLYSLLAFTGSNRAPKRCVMLQDCSLQFADNIILQPWQTNDDVSIAAPEPMLGPLVSIKPNRLGGSCVNAEGLSIAELNNIVVGRLIRPLHALHYDKPSWLACMLYDKHLIIAKIDMRAFNIQPWFYPQDLWRSGKHNYASLLQQAYLSLPDALVQQVSMLDDAAIRTLLSCHYLPIDNLIDIKQ